MVKTIIKSNNKHIGILILGLIIGGAVLQFKGIGKDRYQLFSSTGKGKYQVRNVWGGALFSVFYEGNLTYVRLTGVVSPDVQAGFAKQPCGAGAARTKLQTIMPEFSEVTLQKDSASADNLAARMMYRYVTNDKQADVGAQIVESGFGMVDENTSFDKKESYRKLQQRAQQQKLGLWSECSVSQIGNQYVTN